MDTKCNLGFAKGHNYVLNKLNSRFHAIVNPDILLIEDTFSKIIDFMADRSIGMCIPRITDTKGIMQMVYRRDLTIWDMFIRMLCRNLFPRRIKYHTLQNQDYTKSSQVPFGQGSFLVIRSELFRKLDGFDDRYFMYLEDADLCKRVNAVSKLIYYPDTTVIHKWEQGSHKSVKLFREHVRSMFLYFKKWGIKIF